MAIPVHLQQFKAAGIYRVVFDKSTMLNINSQILRLVVGYSEQGPFNIPTYIPNVATFKSLYGDISKKLEKRGVWFHRMAMQALGAGPILALNLKKFANEKVGAVTVDTDFNSKFEAINLEELFVNDIYDTTRFWELNAEKLNDMRTVDGSSMDKYINISATDTEKSAATIFIRKAVKSLVTQYNVTLNDWYVGEPIPEYLENVKNTLVSDYFAEIFVFKGKFSKEQVLASTSLKKHFTLDDNGELVLRKYEVDAYGEPVDSLMALFNDETSGAIGHYVGSLIPYMTNSKGQYISLDIAFNEDQHIHSMMMSFNTDLLEDENPANINISGKAHLTNKLISEICQGVAKVDVLGNKDAEVVAQTLHYSNNVADDDATTNDLLANVFPFEASTKNIKGTMCVKAFDKDALSVELVNIESDCETNTNKVTIKCGTKAEYESMVKVFENVLVIGETESGDAKAFEPYNSAQWAGTKLVTSIKNLAKDAAAEFVYTLEGNLKISTTDILTTIIATPTFGHSGHTHIYDPSMSFIKINENWEMKQEVTEDGKTIVTLQTITNDNSLLSALAVGDAVVGADTDAKGYYKQVFITAIDVVEASEKLYYVDNQGLAGLKNAIEYEAMDDDTKLTYSPTKFVKISFTETPLVHADEVADPSHQPEQGEVEQWLVRLDGDICQENGLIYPIFLHGYTYENHKPAGTDMLSKLEWQKNILDTLTYYTGLHTGLLNKSDIDYRYIIDTFETYVDNGVKKELAFLAKEKQSAFAILNFPAVKTFIKCPYASYLNDKGVFNVQYVVDGYNKKKAHSKGFSLPSDDEGASFCAFYTPLKFSDGYVDSIVPSAALVSNLFMQKYTTRQPYYIVAGPNYGVMNASGLVGPDYNYSKEELNIIEPYGVNCMVYRPSFGTFINANQTAKQTPVSALSRVNVRELVIYIQDEMEKVLQAYQWEFNNATTRNAILAQANTICTRIQSNGGLQAFRNIMDETNNTPEIIDNEMAVLSTHIEPGFGCGKMVHELTIYKTGGLSSATF